MMQNSYKWLIVGFVGTLVVTCMCFLINVDSHEAAKFLAQSIVDNAVFCIMFLIVVIVTGINI